MKKESLYLDTSVPSAYYDARVKERQESTIKFWKDVLPNYKVYVSEITVKELDNIKDETLKGKFRDLTKDFKVLKVNKNIRDLAEVYIDKGIFPEKYIDDALHVAIASYYEISYLISWNFQHLVKVRTRRSVKLVNSLEGIREIEIISPQEL